MNRKLRLLSGMLALLICAGLWLPLNTGAEQLPAREATEAQETLVPPAEKPALIAHAGGAIYGFRLTNSLEALEQAYACGYRVLEADLSLTSDGEIVLIHDWEEMALRLLGSSGRRSLEEFMASEVFQELTLLSLDDLLRWLESHPDCRIVTDVKETDNVAVLQQLKEQAGEQAAAFIPQIYLPGEYDAVRELGFEDIIFTFYRMGEINHMFLFLFLQNRSFWALTMPFEGLDAQLLQNLSAAGYTIYAHTVNTLSDYETWQSQGLYGIYTDYFQPDHWVDGQG